MAYSSCRGMLWIPVSLLITRFTASVAPLALCAVHMRKGLTKAKGIASTEIRNQPQTPTDPFPHVQWRDMGAHPLELRPELSLTMGQCFSWKHVGQHTWIGAIQLWVVAVRQTREATLYACLSGNEEGLHAYLQQYFQLEWSLRELYEEWSRDERMHRIVQHLEGVRVVRQDPWECLISFICSSNNNISRITLMLDRLRRMYGSYLCTLKRSDSDGRGWVVETGSSPSPAFNPQVLIQEEESSYRVSEVGSRTVLHMHGFPSPAVLAEATEEDLRALGFGYRAKYIIQTAKVIIDHDTDWLLSLRARPREEVQAELIMLPGVGRKVADCVALFSLDQRDAIPVDTHVWRIAHRDMDPSLKGTKSLTPTVYERVGYLFRERFGTCAGWAHSVLFAAELPAFKDRLPKWMVEEMEAFRENEKREKQREKARVNQAERVQVTSTHRGTPKRKKFSKDSTSVDTEAPRISTPETPSPKAEVAKRSKRMTRK